MPYLIQRRVRTSQPQSPVPLKKDSVLANKFIDIWVPSWGARSVVKGAALTAIDGGPVIEPGVSGISYANHGSSLSASSSPGYETGQSMEGTSACTLFSLFTSDDAPSGSGYGYPAGFPSSFNLSYHHPNAAFRNVFAIQMGSWHALAFSVPAANELLFWVGTYDGATIKAYENGRLHSSVSATSSIYDNGSTIGVLTRGSGGSPFNGQVFITGYAATAITAEDVAALYANPWQIFEDEEEYIWVPEAGGDVTVALTGQSYTLSQGTHDVGLSKSVTGQSYTHTQGTLSASVSTSATVVLTGQSYTLSQGSLTKGTSKALTGQSYTLSQGDLGVSTSATVALTGQSYTLSQGAFGVSAGSGSTVELTNQTYTISQGTLGVSTSAIVALTGQTYALSQGAPLPTLDLGLVNQTISYTQGTLGVSVGATVALTGQIYTHTQGTLGVSVGNNVTVALTGQDLNYSQGTFAPGVALAIAGQTYSLSQGTLAVVVGNNATVALTGQSYSLTQGLVGVAATVGLTGQYISFAQGTLGVTTDTNYYVSLAGQSYALTQGVLGVTNDTNYIVPLTGQSYTYSQRAPSVLGATIPTSEMRLYLVPPEDRRYTVPTY